jgi:cullin 1
MVADSVYVEIKKRAKDAILKLIESEREGEQVDKALLKNVLGIFQEVRRGGGGGGQQGGWP